MGTADGARDWVIARQRITFFVDRRYPTPRRVVHPPGTERHCCTSAAQGAVTMKVPLRVLSTLLQRRRVKVALVTLVGAVLRFWGIYHGLREGFIYHPDAQLAVHQAWHHYLGGAWTEGRFGAVYGFLLTLSMWVLDGLGNFAGYPPDWSFEVIASTSSLLTAALGSATIPLVYLLGARAYNPTAGMIAAAFLSVCPLHSFHSHYPYRDVPMVFFLVAVLLACVVIVQRPTWPVLALGGLSAIAAAALKTSGFAVVMPIAAASVMVLLRFRRIWALGAAGVLVGGVLLGVALGGIPGLPGHEEWRLDSLASVVSSFGRFVFAYIAAFGAGFFRGVAAAFRLLAQWLGLPYLVAICAAVAWAIWRRQPGDIVLLAFLVPAFAVAAMFPWLDERYLVPLLPVAGVMLGRAVSEAWRAGHGLKSLRLSLGLAVGGLLLAGLLQSAWQGVLLSLPDTRALSARWLEAHVPRTTRIATEEYYPLGLNEWPNVTFLDPEQPFHHEAAKGDLLVTSSLEHQRYLDTPDRHPRHAAFFATLRREAAPIKSISLLPRGFVHPDIEIYTSHLPRVVPSPRPLLPRPYDTRWNMRVSFLDAGPYDRDDRTIRLSGAQGYTATLVGREPVEEVAVFVLNGPQPSRVRVRVGWTSKMRTLEPGEWRVLRFRPWWLLPTRPALYRLAVGLLPEGTEALIQVRSGVQEIGEGFAQWNRWDRAIPYLERAARESGSNPEILLLLATAYKRVGRGGEARQTVDRLTRVNPAFTDGYFALGRPDIADDAWAAIFRRLMGVEPALLTFALSQDFEAEHLPRQAGRPMPDPMASGGLSVVFVKGHDPAGVVVRGPHAHLAQGAYRARLVLRAWQGADEGPIVILNVRGGGRLLASQPITVRQLVPDDGFVSVPVRFWHADQRERLDFEVVATGLASFAVDKVRVEPDLRETIRQRLLDLQDLLGKDGDRPAGLAEGDLRGGG